MSLSPRQVAENIVGILEFFPAKLAAREGRKLNPYNSHDVEMHRIHKRMIKNLICRRGYYKGCLQQIFEQSAEDLLDHGYPLETPQPGGIGSFSTFYQIGETGIRFEGRCVLRPQHDLVLPAIASYYQSGLIATSEALPYVDISKTTADDVKRLYQNAKRTGLDYTDRRPHNQGLYQAPHWKKPKMVVIDPGAARIASPYGITV